MLIIYTSLNIETCYGIVARVLKIWVGQHGPNGGRKGNMKTNESIELEMKADTITVPKETLTHLGLHKGDWISFEAIGKDTILVRKWNPD